MSPRPRQIPDRQIAEHAAELLVESGPHALTFSQVAQRCGLAPPTLVQRFGRKEALLEAAAAALRLRVVTIFTNQARVSSVLGGLTTALEELADQHAALLRLAHVTGQAAYSLELRKQISFALAMAVEAGELPRCDVAMLARTLQISFTGAVATALLEGLEAKQEVAAAIDAQLANYIGDMRR